LINIKENKSSFSDKSLVQQIRRDNNPKRNYLLVNSKQGKHIPCSPTDSLKLFGELAETIKEEIKNKNTLFIGFAETATAIGAAVASHFENSFYIHTTRENISDDLSVVDFKEEHSHAVEQKLCSSDWESISREADCIVFVEDEISTGKTIMNFINALRSENKVRPDTRFLACSILNGMTDEREKELAEHGVRFHYLVRLEVSGISNELYVYEEKKQELPSSIPYELITINGKLDPRTSVKTLDYIKACGDLSDSILERICFDGLDAAIIGTEECMFPAISTAAAVAEKTSAKSIVTHSTTRSPIYPDSNGDYPIKTRFMVESLYEDERRTYIYNSDSTCYDIVLFLTDSEKENVCIDKLIGAFSSAKKFILVRWVK